ncbi:MAG: hypothetical protein WCK96_00995 [Methylococcales bacterium]
MKYLIVRYIQITLAVFFLSFASTSAGATGTKQTNSADQQEKIPEWVSKLIAELKAAPTANPPTRIVRYLYRGQTVYYQPPRCCDIPSRLFDERGKGICLPDGGMTGGGDGKCPDFFKKRKNEKIIWEDTRSE